MTLTKFLTDLWQRPDEQADLLTPPSSSEKPLCDLVSALPDFLKWERDEQMNGGLAILEVDASQRVLPVMHSQFPHHWSRKTLRKAPAPIRAAMKDLGGLRDKQEVFVMVLAPDLVLLGLWWPWGHGGTISVRLVPHSLEGDRSRVDTCRASLMCALRLQ